MRAFRIMPQYHPIKVAVLSAVALALTAAQEQPQNPSQPTKPLAFEVASIKLTPPEFGGSRAFAPSSGNSLSLQGMSLKALILKTAVGLSLEQRSS
jgi:hypothetical protein